MAIMVDCVSSFFVLQFLAEKTVKIYKALVHSGLVPSPKLQALNDMSAATNHLHSSNFYTFMSYNIKCD